MSEDEEDFGLAKISNEIYAEYINAAGGMRMWTFVIFAFFLNVGSNIFCTYWLSKWMKDVHNDLVIFNNKYFKNFRAIILLILLLI